MSMNGATLSLPGVRICNESKTHSLAERFSEHCPHDCSSLRCGALTPEAKGNRLCKPEELAASEWAAWQKCKEDTATPARFTGHEQGTVWRRRYRMRRKFMPHFPLAALVANLPGRVGEFPSHRLAGATGGLRKAGGVSCTGYAKHHEGSVLAITPSILFRQRAFVWTHRRPLPAMPPPPDFAAPKPSIFSAKRTTHRGSSPSTATAIRFALQPPACYGYVARRHLITPSSGFFYL